MVDKASTESYYSKSGEQLADYDAQNNTNSTLEDSQPCLEIEDSFFVNLEEQLVQHAVNALSRIKDFKSTLDSLERNVESLSARASAVREEIKIPKLQVQRKDTSFLEDDGHEWRKYGEKEVLGSKHPRSYFKCTHKIGCRARKHVQKIQDDPPLFRTTYEGQHSCKDFIKSSDQININAAAAATQEDSSSVITDAAASTLHEDSPYLINFFDDNQEKSSSPSPPPLSSHDLDNMITFGNCSVTVANWLVEVHILETKFLEFDNEVKSQGLEENMENIEQLNQRAETLVEESRHFSEVVVDAYRKVNVEKPTKNAELSVHKKRGINLVGAKVSEGRFLSLENKGESVGSVCNQPNLF
ncbi:hypothetical protein ACP275_04G148700 [Erythranthe tilingii]